MKKILLLLCLSIRLYGFTAVDVYKKGNQSFLVLGEYHDYMSNDYKKTASYKYYTNLLRDLSRLHTDEPIKVFYECSQSSEFWRSGGLQDSVSGYMFSSQKSTRKLSFEPRDTREVSSDLICSAFYQIARAFNAGYSDQLIKEILKRKEILKQNDDVFKVSLGDYLRDLDLQARKVEAFERKILDSTGINLGIHSSYLQGVERVNKFYHFFDKNISLAMVIPEFILKFRSDAESLMIYLLDYTVFDLEMVSEIIDKKRAIVICGAAHAKSIKGILKRLGYDNTFGREVLVPAGVDTEKYLFQMSTAATFAVVHAFA